MKKEKKCKNGNRSIYVLKTFVFLIKNQVVQVNTDINFRRVPDNQIE